MCPSISRAALRRTAAPSRAYPQIEMLPVCKDFTEPFARLGHVESRRTARSSSGINHRQFAATRLAMLQHLAAMCGAGGGLLIGIDLQKDVDTIEAAYNDARGVTAEFNLNVLHRINRELDATFNIDHFQHEAKYDAVNGRIIMSLASVRPQCVTIGELAFEFAAGESIVTEYSPSTPLRGSRDGGPGGAHAATHLDGRKRAVCRVAFCAPGVGLFMIELRRVSKRYGDHAAVCDVDLDCETGKTQALIGPSGCGKSTLLRMIVGLVTPDAGTICFDSMPISRRNRRHAAENRLRHSGGRPFSPPDRPRERGDHAAVSAVGVGANRQAR
jgi:ABC-type multidrug transport system fused ATPase/permease subunit